MCRNSPEGAGHEAGDLYIMAASAAVRRCDVHHGCGAADVGEQMADCVFATSPPYAKSASTVREYQDNIDNLKKPCFQRFQRFALLTVIGACWWIRCHQLRVISQHVRHRWREWLCEDPMALE